jgi:hypothetical protein
MLSLKACLLVGSTAILIVTIIMSIALHIGFESSTQRNTLVLESRNNRRKGARSLS